MYCRLLGLDRPPFAQTPGGPPPELLPAQRCKRSALLAGVREGRPVLVLIGDAGVGKSVLAERLRQELQTEGRAVYVACTPAGSQELTEHVCRELGVGAPLTRAAACMGRLRKALASRRGAKASGDSAAVVILDAAEQLTTEGFRQARVLSTTGTGDGRRLQLVMIGRPELLDRLRDSAFSEIRQQISVARRMQGPSAGELAAYVRGRVRSAGGDAESVFAEGAMDAICARACGNPGTVDAVAAAAIYLARASGASHVTEAMARTVEIGVSARLPSVREPDDGGETRRDDEQSRRSALPAVAGDEEKEMSTVPDKTNAEGSMQAMQRMEMLLERMERATRDADERVGAMETRVGAAIERAAAATGQLAQASQEAGQSSESIQSWLASVEQVCSRADAAREQTAQAAAELEPMCESVTTVATEQADALESRLAAMIERAETALQQMREASDEVGRKEAVASSRLADMDRACERATSVHEHLVQASEQLGPLGETVQENLTLLVSGLDAGEDAHKKLKALTGEVSGLIAEFNQSSQEQSAKVAEVITNCEQVGRQVSATIKRESAELAKQAKSIVRDARAGISGVATDANRIAASFEGETKALVADARERTSDAIEGTRRATELLRGELDEATKSVRQQTAAQGQEASNQIEQAIIAARRDVDGALVDLRTSAAVVHDEAEKVFEESRRTVAGLREEIGGLALPVRAEVAQAVSEARQDVECMTHDLQSCASSVRGDVERIASGARERVATLRDELLGLGQPVRDDVAQMLSEARKDAECMVHDIASAAASSRDEAKRVAEQVREEFGTLKAQAGDVRTRALQDLREDADGAARELAKRTLRRLDRISSRAFRNWKHDLDTLHQSAQMMTGETVRLVDVATRQGRTATEEIESRIADAAERCKRYAEQADERMEAFGAAVQQSNEAVERVAAMRGDVAALESEVDSSVRRGEDAVREQDAAVDELGKTVEQAGQALRIDIASANAKGEQLVSHIAAANDTVGTLAETSTRGQQTVNQLLEREDSLGKLQGKLSTEADQASAKVQTATRTSQQAVGKLLQHLKDRTEAAGQNQQLLAQCNRNAEELLRDVKEATSAGSDVREQLSRIVEKLDTLTDAGRSCIETLIRQIEQGQRTHEQVESTTSAAGASRDRLVSSMDTAREVLAEFDAQCNRDKELIRALTAQFEQGEVLVNRLQTAEQSASGAADGLRERVSAAETTTERVGGLVDRLDSREEQIITQDQVLGQLVQQRETLEVRVEQLATTVESLQIELNGLLTDPKRLVCEAKMQAGQLNDVCKAVKKVFAGLSQASLQAAKRIDELKRLEVAATAMKSWIGKTVQAQEQLSSAMSQQSILLSTLTDGPAEIEGATAAAVEAIPRSLARQPRPQARTRSDAKPVAPASGATQRKRAEEIDRLIREARVRGESASRTPEPVEN